jgi:hypothetical protein
MRVTGRLSLHLHLHLHLHLLLLLLLVLYLLLLICSSLSSIPELRCRGQSTLDSSAWHGLLWLTVMYGHHPGLNSIRHGQSRSTIKVGDWGVSAAGVNGLDHGRACFPLRKGDGGVGAKAWDGMPYGE